MSLVALATTSAMARWNTSLVRSVRNTCNAMPRMNARSVTVTRSENRTFSASVGDVESSGGLMRESAPSIASARTALLSHFGSRRSAR